jgi:hypothetical protein
VYLWRNRRIERVELGLTDDEKGLVVSENLRPLVKALGPGDRSVRR